MDAEYTQRANGKFARKIRKGDEFGSWTVMEDETPKRTMCRCNCGKEVEVDNNSLRAGTSNRCLSCGAKRQKLCKGRIRCPYLSKEEYYRLSTKVSLAIARCTRSSSQYYRYYGARGISVCQEWLDDPSLFVEYLATLDGWDDRILFLDRIDNDGNYEPGNLRFTTTHESAMNKRKRGTALP